ncbi:hypothetical protein ACFX15_002071 [Malus domestica]
MELTDDYRILSYHDPSDPKHDKLKRVIFYLLKSSCDSVLPKFHSSFNLHSLPGDYGLPFVWNAGAVRKKLWMIARRQQRLGPASP